MEIAREDYNKSLDIVHKYHSQLVDRGHMPNWREFYHRRKALGLSMDDVSNVTKISKSTISRLEHGKPVMYNNVYRIHTFYLGNENKLTASGEDRHTSKLDAFFSYMKDFNDYTLDEIDAIWNSFSSGALTKAYTLLKLKYEYAMETCNCNRLTKCNNCDEMVVMCSTGEICPKCYC
jgi:transcriptional regulator with XRE-family HTH domain